MDEEIYILGPTLLERLRGPLFNRRDAHDEEPFVLANDVAQVIYVKDMSTKPRKKKIRKQIHHTMSQSTT